ncbi:hypothetical protein K488DRAFT_39670 [Vararia minispora EC-137]|uniref:Uncharacterized protein n=1 Tax=Vararia minispora EC-137 TaxID=1314806 RepID=A0ACB8QZ59_9AGAM|nr:hypothetical protein K488DRAFT_39670 [Vararia minispora EC-137]
MRFTPFLRTAVEASPLSTVHRGNEFERRSLRLLRENLSMSLTRVGGKSDGGVDLLGWWWLPPRGCTSGATATHERRRLRVLAQCKAEKKKMGPAYLRELEGVVYKHSVAHDRSADTEPTGSKQPIVGLLISQSEFTRASMLAAQASPVPLLLLYLPGLHGEGGIGSAVWNAALGAEKGLLGAELEMRWERDPSGTEGRPGLWWRGARLESWVPDGEPSRLENV